MASVVCATQLHRPKPIRPNVGFHGSKSSVFSVPQRDHDFAPELLQLPVLKKSKSSTPDDCSTGLPKPASLGELAGMSGCKAGRISLEEMAHIEEELRGKPLWLSDCSPAGNDQEETCCDRLRGLKRVSCLSAEKCTMAPSRPANPLVKDRLWLDADSAASSTDSDSEN